MKIQNVKVRNGDIVEIVYPTLFGIARRFGTIYFLERKKITHTNARLSDSDSFNDNDNFYLNTDKIISIRKIGREK
jgi:hypothetical protein